jgi:long-chain acyl-CoA synthetase
VTLTPQHGPRQAGACGWPLPGTSVRLTRSKASDDPEVGEVLVQGPQVMRGYLRDPQGTARVIKDGWLHTGDLGVWTPQGLRIRGRIDGVFKLENGEKIASGEVESRLLGATPLLEQALVIGSGQSSPSALLWLSIPAARAWAEAHHLHPGTPEELAALPELRLALAEAVRASNLLVKATHERVKRVALLAEAPTVDQGELTPTLKLVRDAVLARHAALVGALLGHGRDDRVLTIGPKEEAP